MHRPIVIDSGLIRQTEYDGNTGIEALKLTRNDKSGCVQRAGRAGRVAPGNCHRLFTEGEFKTARDYQVPEIRRSNLSHVVLQMRKMGIEHIENFPFVDPPPPDAIREAIRELKLLGALDEKENVTEVGDFMSELPLEPKMARMIFEASKMEKMAGQLDAEAAKLSEAGIEADAVLMKEKAKELRCTEGLCAIASFFSAKDVFFRPPKSEKEKQAEAVEAHAKFKVSGSDFLSLLKVWRAFEEQNFNFNNPRDKGRFMKWSKENYLRSSALEEVSKVRLQLIRSLGKNNLSAAEGDYPESIGKAIASGLVGNLSSRSGYTGDCRRLSDGQTGKIPRESAYAGMSYQKYFVFHKLHEISFQDKYGNEQKMNLFQNIQEIKPEWIFEIAPQICEPIPDIFEDDYTYYSYELDMEVQESRYRVKGTDFQFSVKKPVRSLADREKTKREQGEVRLKLEVARREQDVEAGRKWEAARREREAAEKQREIDLDEQRKARKSEKREAAKAEKALEINKTPGEKVAEYRGVHLLLARIVESAPVGARGLNKDRADEITGKARERKKAFFPVLQAVAERLAAENPVVESIEGSIESVRSKLTAYIKNKDSVYILGKDFEADRIGDYLDDWDKIGATVEKNELVKEFLPQEKKTEFVLAIQKLFLEHAGDFWKGEKANINALIEKAINEFV